MRGQCLTGFNLDERFSATVSGVTESYLVDARGSIIALANAATLFRGINLVADGMTGSAIWRISAQEGRPPTLEAPSALKDDRADRSHRRSSQVTRRCAEGFGDPGDVIRRELRWS